jgi:hypothetical protein
LVSAVSVSFLLLLGHPFSDSSAFWLLQSSSVSLHSCCLVLCSVTSPVFLSKLQWRIWALCVPINFCWCNSGFIVAFMQWLLLLKICPIFFIFCLDLVCSSGFAKFLGRPIFFRFGGLLL